MGGFTGWAEKSVTSLMKTLAQMVAVSFDEIISLGFWGWVMKGTNDPYAQLCDDCGA